MSPRPLRRDDQARGNALRCPKCGAKRVIVQNTDVRTDGRVVSRRRECIECHHRWSTLEVPVEDMAVDPSDLDFLHESVAVVLRQIEHLRRRGAPAA